MRNTVLFVTSLLSMVGCISNKYVPPQSGDVATLYFSTVDDSYLNVSVVRFADQEYLHSKGESIGMLNSVAIGSKKLNGKPVSVSTSEPFRYQIMGGSYQVGVDSVTTEICMVHQELTAEKGREYRVIFHLAETVCQTKVLVKEAGRFIPIAEGLKNLSSCADPWLTSSGFSNSCEGDHVIEVLPN